MNFGRARNLDCACYHFCTDFKMVIKHVKALFRLVDIKKLEIWAILENFEMFGRRFWKSVRKLILSGSVHHNF